MSLKKTIIVVVILLVAEVLASVLVWSGKPMDGTWEPSFWQFEAFRTPERSIWYRVRPNVSWLEQVVHPATDYSWVQDCPRVLDATYLFDAAAHRSVV